MNTKPCLSSITRFAVWAQGKLLEQFGDGEILSEPEDGARFGGADTPTTTMHGAT